MANARLLSITLERFKSYAGPTHIELSPLTVILGRNNSGKSSIIQALLLLKQTLALPRPEVPLHLDGLVEALNLRELTYGWPAAGENVPGPRITLRWASTVDMQKAWEDAGKPDLHSLASRTGISSLIPDGEPSTDDRITELRLAYAEQNGRIVLDGLSISSFTEADECEAEFLLGRQADGTYNCLLNGLFDDEFASKLSIEWEHFVPYFFLDRRGVGPRDGNRSWFDAFSLLFAQPLDDLKALLSHFAYLGSMRTAPPSLYKAATVPPDDIGVSGEYAAQMLHARRADCVHYLPPLKIEDDSVQIPDKVHARSLVEAVNDILEQLGVGTSLAIDEIKDFGFRLLFGKASLQHVGRGLSYLLPVIQLGLIADPLRFDSSLGEASLDEYLKACPSYTHCAIEESEAHLHPKVQSRLAHWFVSLAMARRQILVETHSDHLVRRLRGLAARAKPGSDLEKWLLENVRVLQIDQQDGKSVVKSAMLTPQGSLEDWPADFMDEATDEERSIYHASLDKPAAPEEPPPEGPEVEHDVGEEPDTDK